MRIDDITKGTAKFVFARKKMKGPVINTRTNVDTTTHLGFEISFIAIFLKNFPT